MWVLKINVIDHNTINIFQRESFFCGLLLGKIEHRIININTIPPKKIII